ncbi:gastrula zinc finger protein XlCGF57.1-like [Xenopus laevis]|uniref:Gastrula zinc finger protein XlCGF57.1-like n=2 Tax=Xenopus laevis TaxID=8355 RepID=A0A8J1KZU9_XENLA|nr:gastrula zinc finger protein XlCGF57.1-like [Xenopus laevis]
MSLTDWGSPEPQPEMLQINIKEEEADREDHVTLSDGGNCLTNEENRCPKPARAQLGIRSPPVTDGSMLAQTRDSAQFRSCSASAKEPGFICNKSGEMFSDNSDVSTHHFACTLYDSQSRDLASAGEFHCTECGKSFACKVSLEEHVKLHTEEKPFPCTDGGKLFAGKSSLQNHQRIHCGAKLFHCAECGKRFSQKVTLHLHQSVHTGEKPFTCKECGRSFSKKDNLRRHKKVHIMEKTCAQCGKCFTQTRPLDRATSLKLFTCPECEKRNHIRELPFRCALCGDGFYGKSYLTMHQKVHEREKPFRRKDCGTTFPEKIHMSVGSPEPQPEMLQIKIKEEEADREDHVTLSDGGNCLTNEENRCPKPARAQLGIRSPPVTDGSMLAQTRDSAQFRSCSASAKEPGFICNKSGEMFSDNSDVSTHHFAGTLYDSQSRDLASAGEFHCTECGKSFACKVSLEEHVKLHTEEKPFPCTDCGKLFAGKSSLQNHQRIHCGAKLFHCAECGKRFSQKVTLHLHQSVHTGEKPFTCKECGRSFSKKDNLRRHKKVHIMEKTCAQCGKCFTQTRPLDRATSLKLFTCPECEKRNHIRELPFRCALCGDGFYGKSYLTMHQKVHEREKPCRRKDCGTTFPEKNKLRKHQEIHNKEAEEGWVSETDRLLVL